MIAQKFIDSVGKELGNIMNSDYIRGEYRGCYVHIDMLKHYVNRVELITFKKGMAEHKMFSHVAQLYAKTLANDYLNGKYEKKETYWKQSQNIQNYIEELESSNARLSNELDVVRDDYDDLKECYDKMFSKCADLVVENKQLENECEDVHKINNDNSDRINKLEKDNANLETLIACIREESKSKNDEINRLKKNNMILNEQKMSVMNQYNTKMAEMRKEFESKIRNLDDINSCRRAIIDYLEK